MIMALISELMMVISGFDRTLMGLDEFPCVVFAFSGRFGRVLASLGSVPYSFATPLAPLDAYLSYDENAI